LTNKSSSI